MNGVIGNYSGVSFYPSNTPKEIPDNQTWIKNNLVVRPTTAWIITNHQLRLMFKEVSDLCLRVRYPDERLVQSA